MRVPLHWTGQSQTLARECVPPATPVFRPRPRWCNFNIKKSHLLAHDSLTSMTQNTAWIQKTCPFCWSVRPLAIGDVRVGSRAVCWAKPSTAMLDCPWSVEGGGTCVSPGLLISHCSWKSSFWKPALIGFLFSSFFPSPHSGYTVISQALSRCSSSGSSWNCPVSMTDRHQVTTPTIFSPYLPCYKKTGSKKNRKNRKMRIRKLGQTSHLGTSTSTVCIFLLHSISLGYYDHQ